MSDAVVCGEGESGVGLLMFRNEPFCMGRSDDEVRGLVRGGLERFNAHARSGGGRIARALILDGQPDIHSGEVTDKGYINQTLARQRRAGDVARLFAARADSDVIILGES